jgi:putative two-component system response regulator
MFPTNTNLYRAPVLVVDDDPICRDLLRNVLESVGYRVEVAADGHEALDLACRGDFRIVLSDWQMPGMSGVELCSRIRGRQLSGYVYFILLTCLDRGENLVAGLRAGADDFINKPFDPKELQVRLRAAERIVSLESRDLLIFSLNGATLRPERTSSGCANTRACSPTIFRRPRSIAESSTPTTCGRSS